MWRPPSPGQHFKIGSPDTDGFTVSTISWHGAVLTRRGDALATSRSVPSFFNLSKNEPGIFTSSSFATRAPRSSSRSTPRAMAMRSALPKALTSTGTSKPCTRSKSSATLASPRLFDTRSTISVISRSRETGALTRRRRPRRSRCATSSRRSLKATRLLVMEGRDQPAGDDGEGEARDHAHPDELPSHERRLPRDDALQPEERPRRHVGDQRGQRGAGVRERDEERHAHHGPAGRDDAGRHGHHEPLQSRLTPEVARDDLLGHDDLKESREEERGNQPRQHEAEHREAVPRADQRERRVLEVRDDGEDDGESGQDEGGGIEAHRPGLWHIDHGDLPRCGVTVRRRRRGPDARGTRGSATTRRAL